ncbi:hypothetical protein SETIT_2G206500v2 [Setaria italica]|uniref:Uncharacterized protein n=1 Tax=Setaria italica TaxID=4555 RepID=A0A368Q0X8_SETIT|nr:hypothetical protein SETIT_2G206500v2 [Setaria italica]
MAWRLITPHYLAAPSPATPFLHVAMLLAMPASHPPHRCTPVSHRSLITPSAPSPPSEASSGTRFMPGLTRLSMNHMSQANDYKLSSSLTLGASAPYLAMDDGAQAGGLHPDPRRVAPLQIAACRHHGAAPIYPCLAVCAMPQTGWVPLAATLTSTMEVVLPPGALLATPAMLRA